MGETFLRREDARYWALQAECQINRGGTPRGSRISRLKTFAKLIDLHIADMCEVGKPPLRSKAAALDLLKQGAELVTLGIDIGMIKLILSHAATVHGLPVKVEPVDLARIALRRLGLVGKGSRARSATDAG